MNFCTGERLIGTMERETDNKRQTRNWILTGVAIAFAALAVVVCLLMRPETEALDRFVIRCGNGQSIEVPAWETRTIVIRDGRIVVEGNRAGGILGGISTGMPLLFRAAFKPTPSIALPQRSVDLATMTETELRVSGRHDPCVAPRAIPVVEAAAALALLDRMLEEKRWTTEN